jgi:hypothetical protein
MALDFPTAPVVGQQFPFTPIPGTPVYIWDGEKWIPSPLNGAVRYDAQQLLTTAQQAQARENIAAGGGGGAVANVLINADFRVNQGGYVSAAVLAAGAYGHDQWKAGASGGNYSFTQLKSSTQITIASGKSLIQPIEDANVVGGSYVLSWTGTAQARAGVNTLTPSGTYATSPLLISGQTAGTAMSVEFNNGTLGTVKLESGAIATPFIMRPYDQELMTCQRYFWKGLALQLRGLVLSGTGVVAMGMTPLASFRAAPTLAISGLIAILDGTASGGANMNGISLNSSTVDTITFNPTVTGSTMATAAAPIIVALGSAGFLIADARL